jgi:hypothetical protein
LQVGVLAEVDRELSDDLLEVASAGPGVGIVGEHLTGLHCICLLGT